MVSVVRVQPGLELQSPNEAFSNTTTIGYNNGSPSGLEALACLDKVIIKQKKELLEIVSNWEAANRYEIKNEQGQQLYYAFEESGCCTRQCCGAQRGYTIHIVDSFNREVIRATRSFKCLAGCCWLACMGCFAHETTIESPPGEIVGTVRQRCSLLHTNFTVTDAVGRTTFEIDGPGCCTMACCGEKEFPVFDTNRERVGAITKTWGGFLKEAFTDADTFGVTFPLGLDVKTKATLIGATFLIDFMAFEKEQNQHNNDTNK